MFALLLLFLFGLMLTQNVTTSLPFIFGDEAQSNRPHTASACTSHRNHTTHHTRGVRYVQDGMCRTDWSAYNFVEDVVCGQFFLFFFMHVGPQTNPTPEELTVTLTQKPEP